MAKEILDSTFEAKPPASESKGSLGAQRIRETRENARYPHQTEHNVGSGFIASFTNDGRHHQGSARVFVKAAAPTALLRPDDSTALTTAEMPSGLLANGSPLSASLGVTDIGRVWVDTSGIYPRVHYWDGTGWVGTHPTWNGFLNGQFKVNQRTAFAAPEVGATSATYWFDRWYTIHTTAAGTVDRNTASLPTGSISPVGIKVIGGAACTAARVGQRLEGARAQVLGADRLANSFITISGKVRNTGTNPITASLVVDTANALDNFAAITNLSTTAAKINALAAGASVNFSQVVDIGTASAGTPANGLDIYLVTTAPAAFVAGENFVVTDLQVEVGSAVTKPWPEDHAEQLVVCQRFYQKSFDYGTKPATNAGLASGPLYMASTPGSAGGTGINWSHGVGMRATPTITTFSPAAVSANWYNVTDAAVSVVPTVTPHSKNTTIESPAATQNRTLVIHATASAEL